VIAIAERVTQEPSKRSAPISTDRSIEAIEAKYNAAIRDRLRKSAKEGQKYVRKQSDEVTTIPSRERCWYCWELKDDSGRCRCDRFGRPEIAVPRHHLPW